MRGTPVRRRTASTGVINTYFGARPLVAWPMMRAIGVRLCSLSAFSETIITPEPAPYLIDPAESPTMNPQVLNLNEGLVLMADAITATGTWRLMVDIAWDEVDPARYYA